MTRIWIRSELRKIKRFFHIPPGESLRLLLLLCLLRGKPLEEATILAAALLASLFLSIILTIRDLGWLSFFYPTYLCGWKWKATRPGCWKANYPAYFAGKWGGVCRKFEFHWFLRWPQMDKMDGWIFSSFFIFSVERYFLSPFSQMVLSLRDEMKDLRRIIYPLRFFSLPLSIAGVFLVRLRLWLWLGIGFFLSLSIFFHLLGAPLSSPLFLLLYFACMYAYICGT